MQHKRINEEVIYGTGDVIAVDRADVEFLRNAAASAVRRRFRLCAHANAEDRLHEMLIVHDDTCYVRAHKHPGKSESYHVIEGSADLILFGDDGAIRDAIELADYLSGKTFFVRINCASYHTLLIRSPVFVFHEISNGPFNRADTVFAPWAPEETDTAGRTSFARRLNENLNRHRESIK